MNQLWMVIKKFYGVELTEEYSEELIDYLDELIKQFPHPLCKELSLALMRYAESEQKNIRNAERRD